MHTIRLIRNAMAVAALLITAGQAAAADVGVSISVGEPGFYGRIDIGEFPYPRPVVIYPRPVIVHRHAFEEDEPLYLRVPPGHAKQWHRYCGLYHACDRHVYFVQDRWYHETYVPQYREYHGGRERGWEDDQGYGGHRDDDRNHGDRQHGRGDHGRGHGRH